MNNIRICILASALAVVSPLLLAADPARVLIVVCPTNHPPGTHEIAAGGRLMQHCLQNMTEVPAEGVKTETPDLAAFNPGSLTPLPSPKKPQSAPATADISRAELLDRIHGGWAGMLIGGLEGLPHEFKYKEQPPLPYSAHHEH